MMTSTSTSTNLSSNATSVTAADKSEDVVQSIDSLLEQLHEKDALLAEKLSVAIATRDINSTRSLPLAPITEDRSVEGEDVASVFTYADYLTSQRSNVRWHNSVQSSVTHASNATVRTAEEIRVIRNIGRRGGTKWDYLSFGASQVSEDGTGSEETPWYNPPIQMQRWAEDQVLPHVNWGDIFFDLFYVGAAFNLGVMSITIAHSGELLRGFIYFAGSLGPLWTTWETKTLYASRYLTCDYFHRILDVVRCLCVGIAIYNITPLQLFSNQDTSNVMNFTLVMLVELMISMGLGVELYYKGLGDKVSIQNHTLDDFKFQNGMLFVLYTTAFIIAAVQYAQARKEDSGDHLIAVDEYGTEYWVSDASDAHHGSVAAGHDTVDSHAVEEAHHEAAAATGDHGAGSGGHRLLSSSSSHEEVYFVGRGIWDIYDLPMTLTTIAYFLRFFLMGMRFFLRGGVKCDVRKWFVPSNIDYLIHRYGEFVMLMIGEGVLSLLIVETVESKEYFMTVGCGLLTMIFIHVLKTESEPHDSTKHALWRSRLRSMWYSVLVQALTVGLIGFGACYKSFLHRIFEDATMSEEDHDYRVIAKRFSAFLTVVILCLELINKSHCGLKEHVGHLFQNNQGNRRLHWPVVIVSLLKMGIILFCATLFVWTADEEWLALAGFCAVLALSVTRVLNHFFISKNESAERIGRE